MYTSLDLIEATCQYIPFMDDEGTYTGQKLTAERRQFLKAAGAAGLSVAAAGCVGSEDTGDGSSTDTGGDSNGGTTTERADSSPDSVTFGQPAAVTGRWDFLQVSVSQGADLAVSEINEAGGPLDSEVSLNRRDTAVNPQNARQVVRQLIDSDGVAAINGLFSSELVPLWDFLQEQQVPVVTPWPGTRYLDTRGGDKNTPQDLNDDEWVWRTVGGDTVSTAGAATAAIDEGYETMAILNGNSSGETNYADAFQNAYENLGGTVSNRIPVPEGESSYQSQIDRLFGADFDAWLVALTLEDAVVALRNWDQGGYGRDIMLESGLLTEDLIKQAGDIASGALVAAGGSQGPNFQQFETKYNDAGDNPLNTWATSSYDSVNILALAIHRAGEVSPEAIERNIGPVARRGGTEVSTFAEGKQALSSGEEISYQGALSNCNFTEHGNVWTSVNVSEVTPDGFETQTTVSAEALQNRIDQY